MLLDGKNTYEVKGKRRNDMNEKKKQKKIVASRPLFHVLYRLGVSTVPLQVDSKCFGMKMVDVCTV